MVLAISGGPGFSRLAAGPRIECADSPAPRYDRLLVNRFRTRARLPGVARQWASPSCAYRRRRLSGEPDVIGTLGGCTTRAKPAGRFRRSSASDKAQALTNFIAPLTSRRSGRITLLVSGPFVGFHLFARYTIPQHL